MINRRDSHREQSRLARLNRTRDFPRDFMVFIAHRNMFEYRHGRKRARLAHDLTDGNELA